MGNTFSWSIIRLVQRLAMVLTLACCAYVVFFLLSKNKENTISPNNSTAAPASGLISLTPLLDVKAYDASANTQGRDIFSLTTDVSPTGTVENAPKGQLPDHLKIVGVLVSNPSEIIIEDSFANKTYFIDENSPQAGIKIVGVKQDQMTINYQGQDINVPITKE